jgi:hypothetical protein
MSLYEDVMSELESREIYKYQTYAPFYISSFALHNFNLLNQKKKVMWSGKDIPNSRLHILFNSPAGYMKSYFLKQMAGSEYGIFRGADVKIGFEQEMTSPAFTGTSTSFNGFKTRSIGAAEEYSDGLMLIDEFRGLTEALSSEGNGQFESQLLSALDSGRIVKRLANDRFEFTTHLTLWTGVQPAKFDISSGLGRRLCYMLFIPTRKDNDMLIDAMERSQGMKADLLEMKKLWYKEKTFINDLNKIESVEFAPDVWSEYKKMKIFSFESTFFNNLLLGLHLAKFGADKKIVVDLKDKDIRKVIELEKDWRKKINQGVPFILMLNIIHGLGANATLNEVAEEATMIGYNLTQTTDLVTEMARMGLLARRGNKISVVK